MRFLTKSSKLVVAFVLCAGAGLSQAQILVINTDSITTYKATAASAVQDIRPLHRQRGVGIDGSLRAGSVQGWALAGNPFGDNAPAAARIGDVNLATGTYMPTEVDIALPQAGMARWVIGRSFNGRQETSSPAHRDSNGPQGYNWFQMSQPELVLYVNSGDHTKDLIHLVYGADRYAEFQRTGASSTEYLATNGAAGVIQYDPGLGGGSDPDFYMYYDQRGVKTYFWGAINTGPAAYQIWKIVDPAGNIAYVGDPTTMSTALSSGYDGSGRITTAYDPAGRRYCYSYSSSTIGGVKRLEQVLVETDAGGGWGGCGTETTVAKVEYGYYTTNEANKGLIGDLKTVTLTTPLTDSGITQVKKKLLRYYDQAYANSSGRRGEPHEVKMVIGYEGYRRHDWNLDGVLNDDPLSDTDAHLMSYSDAYLEYADTAGSWPYYVSSGFFNGECGCGGGSGNGTYQFTYGNNGSFSPSSGYDTAWKDRVVIIQPDAVYATQYFDECGQPLSRVVTNTDPASSPTKTWATEVVRDSTYPGSVIEMHTPANITAYTHSTGAFTRSSSVGLVNVFGRVSSGNMTGFPESMQHKEGNSGTAYFDSWSSYASRDLVVGATSDYRPMISARRSYYGVATAYNTSNTYDETTMSYAWWSGTNTNILYVALKQATTTNPVVSTATNGSNATTTMDRFIRKDGTTAFSLAPDGIYDYTLFTNGQMTKNIRDAKTNGTFVGGDDPNTDWGITETGNGSDRITLYAYDPQGRPDTVTDPDGRVHKSYYSRLSDQRGVSINWPMKTTAAGGTYFGPAGYSVATHAGRGEFSGLIAIAAAGSTAALTSWINESTADPISAVTTGTLARMSTSTLDSAGVRVIESRSYFLIPGSGAGSVGTNYDAAKYTYDDMGRTIRTEDATGTLTRTSFDELGRVSQTHLGTDDTGYAGSTMAGSANMVKTAENEYDSGAAGGNSFLTKRTAFVENSTTDRRDTTYAYDFRGRVLLTTNPQAPHTLTNYDNLGRPVATAQYSSTGSITPGTTDPGATGTQSNRVALSKTYYDELGRVYQSERYKIDQSDGSDDDSIARKSWFDPAGRLIRVFGDGTHTKSRYDRLGRPTDTFTLATTDDSQYGHASASTAIWNTTDNKTSVAGDKVLEETHTAYESTDSDNVLMRTTVMRNWNDTSTTGELDSNADTDPLKVTAANVKGRVQISPMWYDALDRVTDTVSLGTNAIVGDGSTSTGTYDRAANSSPPARSSTALVFTSAYNDDGTVQTMEAPGRPANSFGVGGIITKFVYDALGRKTKEIHNYDGAVNSGNPSGSADNQTITYTFSKGLQTAVTAVMPSGGTDQTTTYIYGTTAGTPSANKVTTNNRLRAVKYPDSANPGTTAAYIDGTSDADVASYAYNAQGQRTQVKDQSGNVVLSVYDTAGRETDRKATTVISGFDGAVQRITTAYLARGPVDTVTQYDAPSSGGVTDQVQYAYDGWGNIETFTQDPDSAIGGGGRASFAITYTYAKATPTNAAECVRRTVMASPGGSDINYAYQSSAGCLDDAASRVTTLTVNAVEVARYEYLGGATVMKTLHNEPHAYHNDVSSTAGVYPMFDRFNRRVTTSWVAKGNSIALVDLAITYDLDSNITSVTDNVNKNVGGNRNFDAKYTMDDLSRLLRTEEGTYSAGSISNRSRDEQWTDGTNPKLSHTGNWLRHRLDLNGNGTFTDAGDETQSSDTSFNDVNEQTARTFLLSNASTTYTSAYDDVGNLIDDGKDYAYTYDVFGRLRQVYTRGGSPVLKSEYTYNGLNFRIGWHYDVTRVGGMAGPDGNVDGNDPWFWFCHDERWQNVATFRSTDSDPKERFIYHNAGLGGAGGSSYIDDMVCRNRDANTAWHIAADGVLEERRYLLHNWRHDVAAVLADDGKAVESVKHSAYGVAFGLPVGDTDSDGDWDATDSAAITGGYDVRKDADQDGSIAAADVTWANAVASGYQTLGRGVLTSVAVANRKGYAGYEFSPELLGSKFHVRNRVLDSETGRWTRRDPLGYVEGMGLYSYVSNMGTSRTDPSGFISLSCGAKRCAADPTVPLPPEIGPPTPAQQCCQTACNAPRHPVATTICCQRRVVSCICPGNVPPGSPYDSVPFKDHFLSCLRQCEPTNQTGTDCSGSEYNPTPPSTDPCGTPCNDCNTITCAANCLDGFNCQNHPLPNDCAAVVRAYHIAATKRCEQCTACRASHGQPPSP